MKSNYWTKKEIDFLKENYSTMPIKDISLSLKKSESSVYHKKSRLGLVITKHIFIKKPKRWTKKEDKFLKENYNKLPTKEIASLLERTISSIYLRLQKNGLIRVKVNKWTNKEIEFLKNNYRFLTNKELSKKLKHSEKSVATKRGNLKLKRDKYLCEIKKGKIVNSQYTNAWTKNEINILKNNYNKLNNHELEKLLPKRTYQSIFGKLYSLGLTRTEEFRKSIFSRKGKDHPMYGTKLSQEHINMLKEKNTKKLDLEYIKENYLEQKKSLEFISKKLNVSTSTIWKKLKLIGVKTRGTGKKGVIRSEKFRKNLSKKLTGRKLSESTIEKIKEGRAKQSPTFTSSQEIKIQNFLKKLGISFFIHQYIKIPHGYQCDILIPSMNLVIECDGDFMHCNPKKYSSDFVRFPNSKTNQPASVIWELDNIRTSELLSAGFKVLRLWEHEINDMTIKQFEERLNET